MATSNSNNYATSTQEIITEALELLGVLGEGEAYTPAQYTSSVRTLNMMIKNWQAAGLNLFAVQLNILFLKKGIGRYLLADPSPHLFSPAVNVGKTTAAAIVGATVVNVSFPATSLFVGISIGIELESGTDVFWTTVLSFVGSVVTLADPLPTQVLIDATVFLAYTKGTRPMRILEAYYRRNDNTNYPVDIPMGILSRVDYGQLATKTIVAQPLQLYFDPGVDGASVYIWPTPNNEVDFILLNCQRTLSDFDDPANAPDYPQEWFLPLAYGLAVLLAPKYGTPVQDYARIQQTAEKLYQTAFDWDVEQQTSVYFKPDNWGMGIGRRGN